jgi:L-rhamnose mutarotase
VPRAARGRLARRRGDHHRLQLAELHDLADGDLLVSSYEYVGDDHAADMARMATDAETQRWWLLTDPCQERLPGTPEGEQWMRLPEIWHLN